MKIKILSLCLFLSSCSPLLIADAPNTRYELNKVDDLLVSNSPRLFGQSIFTQRDGNTKEVQLILLVTNTNAKSNVNLKLTEAQLAYSTFSVPAACALDPVTPSINSFYVQCKISIDSSSILSQLGKSDLIGELRIPVEGKTKLVTTQIYIRNEEFK